MGVFSLGVFLDSTVFDDRDATLSVESIGGVSVFFLLSTLDSTFWVVCWVFWSSAGVLLISVLGSF